MNNEKEALVSVPVESTFAQDVDMGLSGFPKTLPSKYFYNKVGDKIFQEIMEMEEYYLTRAEHSIFQNQRENILSEITKGDQSFRLLELGAGDGLKTRVLLDYFVKKHVEFDYCPVDISGHVLEILKKEVSTEIPDLSISPLVGDYFDVLGSLTYQENLKNVVFFLGSNIGNFNNEKATVFLSKLAQYLNKGDLVLIGFDLRKDPDLILSAYHDKGGITRRFNLNLLNRINEELGADIDVDSFEHYPIYNPSTGECKSYLINTNYQKFHIEALKKDFVLDAWEPIFTEVSKKYSEREIDQLSGDSGFRRIADFYDGNRYFVDSLWEVK